ncbi:hypothetical protein [Fluviicola sp.]|uniref:hypothetical protein n=1 Tax=Fluviicola sp. TaxID=1917219 RepID=UPI003D27696C
MQILFRTYQKGTFTSVLTSTKSVLNAQSYKHARYYDSDIARFLSLDPLASKFPALSASSFRLTNGVANGSKFSPKVYGSGWTGGSRANISTYKTAGLGGLLSKATFGLGVILDGVGVINYYTEGADSPNAVHPVKAAVNTGFGAFALELNPITGIVYTGIDALYLGGWVGLSNDQHRLEQENKAINPDWQLWPGAMKQ